MSQRTSKTSIKVINIMKDGRRLESLEGIDAPDILYDILLKCHKERGVVLVPVTDTIMTTK